MVGDETAAETLVQHLVTAFYAFSQRSKPLHAKSRGVAYAYARIFPNDVEYAGRQRACAKGAVL
jgi:hypothetical protein